MFQFPSSGKGRSKPSPRADDAVLPVVSIPFKREGAFKGTSFFNSLLGGSEKFQFPSSGKGRSKSYTSSDKFVEKTFQFPSSGKGRSKPKRHIPTRREIPTVSIPFKREGVFKVSARTLRLIVEKVSIPFKREGVFKAGGTVETAWRC